jgi:uncharacterized protein YunC (DUF1805 family)
MNNPDPNIEGLRPTVHLDAGSKGRIVVADSLSYFYEFVSVDDVAVGASFAGALTAAIPLRRGVKAWIAHEAGPGKDQAGISGLRLAQQFGIPAAAIATMTARLSDGRSLLDGTISHVNDAAGRLGVKVGQTGEEAARAMLEAGAGCACDIGSLVDESLHELTAPGGRKVYACWSFSRVPVPMPGSVFCVASHGAKIMAHYALEKQPKAVICNDAGGGLDDSGSEGLAILEAHGVLAATVSTESARIGDPLSTYHDGIISVANRLARDCGVQPGIRARDAAALMLRA